MEKTTKIELTPWSVIRTILILLSFGILWQIRGILVLLFIVLILVAALEPIVVALKRFRIPRVLGAGIATILVMVALGFLLALIVPALVHQLQQFITDQLPGVIDRVRPFYESVTLGQQVLTNVVSQLQRLSGNVVLGVITAFGSLFSVLTVLILTFYLLAEEQHPLEKALLETLPAQHQRQVTASLNRITEKLGAWLRGQFILSSVIGLATAIAMSAIGVAAPLAIGILAGVLEIVPIVGPLITGVIILLMALISPAPVLIKVILSLVYFVLLQVLEGQLLVPKVMEKAVGLSPVLVIVALLVGSNLGGVAGAILAIPLAAIMQVVVEDWPKFRFS